MASKTYIAKVIFILLILDKYYFFMYTCFGGEKYERCNVNKDRKDSYAKNKGLL